ncbi:hypothetical protein G8C15_14265 [Enterococcus casseliflavus]|nr:hypothetical protein [Enterococcus casseliflavus]
MNLSEVINGMYFDSHNIVFSQETKTKYPLLYREFNRIKDESLDLIKETESTDLFTIVKKLLILDAYLQNMLSFINFDDNYYSESEILEHCARDKFAYYKESFGCRLNDHSPNILLFNILENGCLKNLKQQTKE